jgi:NADP-dependent 3-hydroxy acid dehydrogenase YdfG
VVNISSDRGLYCYPGSSGYQITKFGVEAFTDTLRQEMAQFGVKAIVIAPGHFGLATDILNDANVSIGACVRS